MTLSTTFSQMSNTSDQSHREVADTFAAWRSLAYAVAQYSDSPAIGEHSTLLRSETAIPTRDDRYNAFRTILEQANYTAGNRRVAAARAAFGIMNERRSNPAMIQSARVTGMEKWDGTVAEVDDDYFTVDLAPLKDGTEITADFPRDLIPDDDLQIGDVVYITVRTVEGSGGPKRTSTVRLRRLGRWSESEITDQRDRASKRLAALESKFA